MTFADWVDGTPSFLDQNCVQMMEDHYYKWDNEFCDKTHKFICKRNKGS